MNLFLDTSALFKLYHQESGTAKIDLLFSDNDISIVFLSEIAKIEFASTVWKKVRMQEISEQQAKTKIALFEADFNKYNFICINDDITSHARGLINIYGKDGLRTLDSIQFSTALSIFNQCELFITTDKLLNSLFELEGLPTKNK